MKSGAVVGALAILVAACSSASPIPGSTATPAASSTVSSKPSATLGPSVPVGLIAIGHSGLTGEGTGDLGEAASENSWATGTSSEVNSVYLRLAAARPQTTGHVSNAAKGGATVAFLVGQAQSALQLVPAPSLVIISTIDNDIRCNGTDDQHIPEFGAALAEALDVITAASPDSKILVVGQLGRPSTTFIEELVSRVPYLKASMAGTGICDFFDADENIVTENFATLTAIIDAYEAEQARVCAAVPQCSTDGGVRAAYKDEIENFSPDWAHLNIRGQAAEAELIWPVVVSLLGL